MIYACGKADRSTMGTVRLKSDATTDSIEFVVKEMLVAISTNDIEKARYHVLEDGRVFRVRKDGRGFRSNSEFFNPSLIKLCLNRVPKITGCCASLPSKKNPTTASPP